jgi:cation:H+ antiporter
MLTNVSYILIGLTLLVFGAQLLVRGASTLAVAIGISPLIVGLTVVAFGTSAPELAVSIQSCLSGQTNIVMGNVVGSNIYNILFILGLCAVITPLAIAPQLIRKDVPIMIGAAVMLYVMSLDGMLSRIDGAILVSSLAAYTFFVIRQSKKEKQAVQEDYKEQMEQDGPADKRWWFHGLLIGGGLLLLTFGSDLLVKGAVSIAKSMGVSDLIIGMTIVTIGTTAPEVSSSLVASFRGARDLAVGNIVGSNIFNVLAVLGTGGLVAPAGITVEADVLNFGLPVVIAASIACLPIFFAGHEIRRWEGALFLGYFVLYLLRLIIEARRDPWLQTFDYTVFWFVIPLTAVGLIVSVWRELKSRARAKEKQAAEHG